MKHRKAKRSKAQPKARAKAKVSLQLGRGGGGAATAAGTDYQNRVAAWIAVYILAEKSSPPPFDLPQDVTLEHLWCETSEPVDDILISTSAKGLVFLQCKRKIGLSASPSSEFALVIEQFVRQFLKSRNAVGPLLWDRPLDTERDRLVLVAGPKSPQAVRDNLPSLLEKVRSLATGQSQESLVLNAREKHALEVINKNVKRSWRKFAKAAPSNEDIRQLLILIRFESLAVEPGQENEREAKKTLRNSILEKAVQSNTAWTTLVTECARHATAHTSSSRESFQRLLIKSACSLRTVRGYQDDVARLEQVSQGMADRAARLSLIRMGSITIKITRQCTEALYSRAMEGSFLVVGEPGSGKSGTLYDLAQRLKAEGNDVVFLSVSDLDANSAGALRNDLNLTHDLEDILNNWQGSRHAFLIVDSLDAARGMPAEQALRALLTSVVSKESRWQVIASIRKYDLRYSREYQRLFASPAGTSTDRFSDPEFGGLSHINIPELLDEEMGQLERIAPQLYELVITAQSEIKKIVRNPFNLRLMAELLGLGVGREHLSPIRTSRQLLDKYWDERVVNSDLQGNDRENLLQRTCEEMVASRILRAPRLRIVPLGASQILEDLLSRNILIEWPPSSTASPDRNLLGFAHHVLFDYAVARLILRLDHPQLIERFRIDPDLPLLVHPSLEMHYQYLWDRESDHASFWNLVLMVSGHENITAIFKLIGPSVAAALSQSLSDLQPLTATLGGTSIDGRAKAEKSLGYLFGSLMALQPTLPLSGDGAGPWCELLEKISQSIRPSVAFLLRGLLQAIADKPHLMTTTQRVSFGKAARELLAFARNQTPRRDEWLVIHSLQAVCRTYDTDSHASATLIREMLLPDYMRLNAYREMSWLSREVKHLIGTAPDLVDEIYRATFSYQEVSTELTLMGQSQILPMSSTKKQDFEMAQFGLAEIFPHYLKQKPLNAVRTLIEVVGVYISQEHRGSSEDPEEQFNFGTDQVYLREDSSQIWDQGDLYDHDYPVRMLREFESYVKERAGSEFGNVEPLLRALITGNRWAYLWRRILLLGEAYPHTVGVFLKPLGSSLPILKSRDTRGPASQFLRAIYSLLTDLERQNVEVIILSIPSTEPPEEREWAEMVRDSILRSIPHEALVTSDARQIASGLQAATESEDSRLAVRTVLRQRRSDEEAYLEREGVPVDLPANVHLRELEKPVLEFASRFQHSAPSREDVIAVAPFVDALASGLQNATLEGVHPKQIEHAEDELLNACGCIADCRELPSLEEIGNRIKLILLNSIHHPNPEPESPTENSSRSLGWSTPAPRLRAAHGLITIALHVHFATPEVLQAVELLCNDPVPAVRLQITRYLNSLHDSAPDLMWRLLEERTRGETHAGVLEYLFHGPFGQLLAVNSERIIGLVTILFRQARTSGGDVDEIRGLCAQLFIDQYLWLDNPIAKATVLEIVANPQLYSVEARQIPFRLRNLLVLGSVVSPDPRQETVRLRSISLLQSLVGAVRERIRTLLRSLEAQANDESRQQLTNLYRLADDIGNQVYFVARETAHSDTPISEQQKYRFYQEGRPIFEELCEIGHPSLVHHLLEALDSFVPFDPRGVFLLMGRLIAAGKAWGYQYESMGADLMARLVERYLADHRTILQQESDCRAALRTILEVFIEAGWPSTVRLVYHLPEMFR